MEKMKLMIVDDDEGIRTQMKWALNDDYDVFAAEDSDSACRILEEVSPALVTLDLGLPPDAEGIGEGLRLLDLILERDASTKVIVVSGNPDKEAPLLAISKGAHDFFTKPINIDELKAILKRAGYVQGLERKNRLLKEKLEIERVGEMIGDSPIMQEVFKTVRKVATAEVPVLVTGESGTGKELVAKALHGQSARAKGPFVPINCGAIPENLMESELFGHEKGAFTGAHVQRMGKIEMAEGGTLFLDEIGDLPLSLQVKLLRFLQDKLIERIGSRSSIEVDVRIVAATNKNLDELIMKEEFREDLFYRIAVVQIDLPPLRERGDDLLLLARSFLRRYSWDSSVKSFGPDAINEIKSYHWPGNVRELENKIQRGVAFADGPVMSAYDLGFKSSEASECIDHSSLDLKTARERVDIEYINLALNKNSGNISKAADDLGLTRPTLHTLLKKYQIKAKDSKETMQEALS